MHSFLRKAVASWKNALKIRVSRDKESAVKQASHLYLASGMSKLLQKGDHASER